MKVEGKECPKCGCTERYVCHTKGSARTRCTGCQKKAYREWAERPVDPATGKPISKAEWTGLQSSVEQDYRIALVGQRSSNR